ncbi:MAG: HipA domain-containing protein [Oscillospiraceae bacterium]|nr:HipA domain-containing protein [Oscillospiraceae bacterium]MCL2277927.1 HipA domain-containing protein [Oscillospiraceae bacterium]
MVKMQPKPKQKTSSELEYTYGCISEHIGCKIAASLGVDAQETMLGVYRGKISVACKDFETDGFVLKEFAHLKNTIIDSEGSGYGTELSDIIATIRSQSLLSADMLEQYFWDMFVIDAYIGNFDRHNGNWGFLINENSGAVKIAPMYDCGSSLYPSINESIMQNVLNNNEELRNRIFVFPNSAIKNNDIKINYERFLVNTNDDMLLKAVIKIGERINHETTDKIISETPYISEIHKAFLSTITKARYDYIISPSLERAKNIVKLPHLNSKESYIKAIDKAVAEDKNNGKRPKHNTQHEPRQKISPHGEDTNSAY